MSSYEYIFLRVFFLFQSFFEHLIWICFSEFFFIFAGFLNLSLSDQMNLLQHSWLEILCLNLIFRSCPYNGFLKFAEDLLISPEDSKVCMCSTEFDNLTRKLCKKFTGLGVTKEEYLMLKAMILCNIGEYSMSTSSRC